MNEYVRYLIGLGFSEEMALTIDEGRRVEALREDEFYTAVSALKSDDGEMLQPLFDKYGKEDFVKRLGNSIEISNT